MTYPRHDDLQFRHLTTLLRRRWRLVATVTLAGGVLALVLGFVLPARYMAKVQILVEPPGAGVLEGSGEAAVETHVELLLSPSHLQRVHKSLADGADAASGGGADVRPDALALGSDVPGFEELKSKINVYKERQSRVIAVTYTATDPRTAAAIANRIAELYVEQVQQSARARRQKAELVLAERIAEARLDLERAEAAVREARAVQGFADGTDADFIDREIADLRRQFALAQAELDERNARLALIEGYALHDGASQTVTDALRDPLPSEFDVPQAGSGTEAVPTPVPDVVVGDAPANREKASGVLAESAEQLSLERDAVAVRVQRLRDRLASVERRRVAIYAAQNALREPERAAAAALDFYQELLRRKADLSSQEGLRPEVRIVSAATPPEVPSSPAPILFVLPALVAAGLLGGLSAAVLERLDHRLRSERDVEDALDIPCIGLVPKTDGTMDLAAQRRLIDCPFEPYTEAIRSVVATSLAHASPEATICLVTSSQQGEGRTTLAVSFAVYAALLGPRVLLIDLDFRNFGMARVLGRPDESGIVDAVNGRAPEQVIRRIPELGIDYLPFSRERTYPLVVFSTDRLPAMLEHLSRQYDCIVIDSGPLLGATEARIFASLAHKVIFAIKWGEIDAEIGRDALRRLGHGGNDRIAGRVSAVLTQVNMRDHISSRYGGIRDPSHVSAPASPAASERANQRALTLVTSAA